MRKLLVLFVLVGGLYGFIGKVSKTALQTGDIQITLTPNAISNGKSIPADFMGLMFPLADVTAVIGSSSTNLNPIFLNLLSQLTQYGNAPMSIRIGNTNLNYTSQRKGALIGLAKATNVRYILGVNMLKTNATYYTDTIAPLLSSIPPSSLHAIENGNEADLFKNIPGWDYNAFLSQYGVFQGYMSGIGQPKIAAPVWSGTNSAFSNSNLNSFVSNNVSKLAFVDMHFYATSNCKTSPPSGVLLAENQVTGGPNFYASSITNAHNNNLGFRLTEWNSSSCSGTPGVSDAFESALWLLDGAYTWVNAGLDGMNVTTNNNSFYSPFYFQSTSPNGISTYQLNNVAPIYYGMKMFMQSTQNKAKLVSVQTINTNNYNVKAWATVDETNTVRVLLINKDVNFTGTIDLALSGYGPGTGYRLTAPTYSSQNGLAYAGQTYDGSSNGNPLGTQTTETYTAPSGQNGHYFVSFNKAEAVLIEFRPEKASSSDLGLQVFPNPSSGKIMVSYPVSIENAMLKIISSTGQIVHKSRINTLDFQSTIDIQKFPSGVYIVVLESGTNRQCQKFIK